MSGRRGNRAAAQPADSHNTLESLDSDTDPVKGAIHFGMETLKRIINDTIPYCPADNEEMKREVAEKMESYFLQMVEAELIHEKTEELVNQVVEELALQDNPDMDAKEFTEGLDSMNGLLDQRIAEYKETLTESVLKSHPRYAEMKQHLTPLLDGGSAMDTSVADAETEGEDVDLDDSVVDVDTDNEAIPTLDPVTKQALEDPCRNRICRHIYGKASMLQLIKKNPRTRCPAMGCSNNNFVKAADLIDDPALTAKVTGQPMPPKVTKQSPRAGTSKAKRGKRKR